MNRIAAFALVLVIFGTTIASSVHDHGGEDHGAIHSCLLCLVAQGTVLVPHIHALQDHFASVSPLALTPADIPHCRSFILIPASRAPPYP